jgi:hypothetical protein
MTTSDIHALSGAYALDAVDDLERVAVERHLRECDPCEQEIYEFQETVTRLADAVAMAPPPGMRSSVLEAISRTPQARPGRADRAPSGAGTNRGWRRFAAGAVAAGVVAAGVGIGTWTVADRRADNAQTQAAAERARVAQIEDVLAAPDARLRVERVDGGTMSVVASPSRDRAVVTLSGLQMPDPSLVYQLWRVNDAGALRAEPEDHLKPGQGSYTTLIDGLAGFNKIGLTREQPGGALKPNTNELVTLAPF